MFGRVQNGRASLVLSGLCGLLVATGSALADFPPRPASPVSIEKPERVPQETGQRRRPLACCLSPSGNWLFVANGRSGTVSAIDARVNELAGEWKIGEQLSTLVHWQGDLYLASDPQAAQLICLDFSDPHQPVLVWRYNTIASPNRLWPDVDSKRCYVGGLWSRRLAKIDFSAGPDGSATAVPCAQRIVDLPFSAGALCHLDGERPALLVFDAFSGGWSAHDPNSLQVSSGGRNRSRRTSAAAIDPENGNVCLAGQSLNPLAHSIRNDVHWGLVVANQIRSCPASQFVSTSVTDTSGREPAPAESMLSGITIPLGGASDGKADPESIEFASNGTAVITLGGVDQVAVGQLAGASFQYYSTGRRPVATAVSGNNKRLFVCNFLDDSVTVIDMRDREIVATISLGPQPERTRVDEGERLFFDGRISHDGWMSCHSCHVNGHSNGFLNDNLGDQSFGAPKRVLSLLGRDGTAPFAWNGSASLLSEQIRSSIVNTMQSDTKPSEASVDALAAYVRSLAEPAGLTQSRSAPDDRALIDRIETGRSLFHELGCASCHVPDRQWTSPLTYDLGISDELGKKRFNPPSLKGVGQGATFFHDARYDELADVFRLGKHRLQRELSDDELRDLLAFLQSL